MLEQQETAFYDAILKDIRRGNMRDEKQCDETLEIIEVEYRLDRISDEQVRYATRLLLSKSE